MESRNTDPIDFLVGASIRKRRMALGLTEEALGDSLGLTFQEVRKYEQGDGRVGARRLRQIATVLAVNPAFFFEDAASSLSGARTSCAETDPGRISAFIATAEGLALMRGFVRIADPKLRRYIVQLVTQINPEPE